MPRARSAAVGSFWCGRVFGCWPTLALGRRLALWPSSSSSPRRPDLRGGPRCSAPTRTSLPARAAGTKGRHRPAGCPGVLLAGLAPRGVLRCPTPPKCACRFHSALLRLGTTRQRMYRLIGGTLTQGASLEFLSAALVGSVRLAALDISFHAALTRSTHVV